MCSWRILARTCGLEDQRWKVFGGGVGRRAVLPTWGQKRADRHQSPGNRRGQKTRSGSDRDGDSKRGAAAAKRAANVYCATAAFLPEFSAGPLVKGLSRLGSLFCMPGWGGKKPKR